MAIVKLDKTDRNLLNLLQAGFPLVEEPFAEMALSMGLDEGEVIQRIMRLKDEQIIRSIGPIFDSRRLGYQSTLVAMHVPQRRLEQAAKIISQHPGVSHNYQRRHYYNLWFTLAISGDANQGGTQFIDSQLQKLRQDVNPKIMFDLPVVRLFKINTFFDMSGNGHSAKSSTVGTQFVASSVESWDVAEQMVITELQQDVPLVSRPFDAMATHVDMGVDEFLKRCHSLKDRGVMRRFGASVKHRNAGFAANAMVCWIVPQAVVDTVGQKMAAFSEVSHCYERKTNPLWPYNMFTMIHGKTRKECWDTVERISAETGIKEYEALFTIKEFKKERVKYLAPTVNKRGTYYYPIFLDIKEKRCVVIGGGEVALRKARMLLEHEALVEIISPELCPELNELVENSTVKAILREYESGDLKGAFVVVAATDDSKTNEQAAEEAMERGILINVVDVPKLSNFIVPSYLRRGDVAIAVSTGGKSPALARKIRSVLENSFGDEYAALALLLDEVRSELKEREASVPGEVWQQALDLEILLEHLRRGQRDEAKKRLLGILGRHE